MFFWHLLKAFKADGRRIKEFMKKTCWCGIIASLLILIFTWVGASWANIVVTIVAIILLLISIFGCCCKKGAVKKETPVSTPPPTPPTT